MSERNYPDSPIEALKATAAVAYIIGETAVKAAFGLAVIGGVAKAGDALHIWGGHAKAPIERHDGHQPGVNTTTHLNKYAHEHGIVLNKK